MSYNENGLYKWSSFREIQTGRIIPFAQSESYAMNQLGIPRKYAKVFINTIKPKTTEQVQLINTMWQLVNTKNAKAALICNGVNHCGKTHIACGLINYLDMCDMANNGNPITNSPSNYRPRYVAEADFLDRITSFRATTNFFDFYTDSCKVLVIDEFGSCKWSATETRKVNQVLNKRFNNKYQTIILTNRTMPEIFALIGDDVQSRFHGCYSITMRQKVEYEATQTEPSKKDIDWLY